MCALVLVRAQNNIAGRIPEKLVSMATSGEGSQCQGSGETGPLLLMGLPFEYALMSEKSHLIQEAFLDCQ